MSAPTRSRSSGSVRMRAPSTSMRTVEWPTKVAASEAAAVSVLIRAPYGEERRRLDLPRGAECTRRVHTAREARSHPGVQPSLEDTHDRHCLLYTSDAADDLLCVDLGG